MFDFLSYGFGSVFGGFLTALAVSGAMLFLSVKSSRNGGLSPLALIVAFVLFCLLFFQFTSMYSAISYKGTALKFISGLNLQYGDNINGAELKELVGEAITQNPLLYFFIDYADFEDFDWSRPIHSLHSIVAREFNYYILRRLAWSLLFSLLGAAAIYFTGQSGNGKSRRRSGKRRHGTARRDYSEDFY